MALDFESAASYLQAYANMRKTVLDGLNTMPNFKMVTVTDEVYECTLRSAQKLSKTSGIDFFVEALKTTSRWSKSCPP